MYIFLVTDLEKSTESRKTFAACCHLKKAFPNPFTIGVKYVRVYKMFRRAKGVEVSNSI